jgi:hypothetical protein
MLQARGVNLTAIEERVASALGRGRKNIALEVALACSLRDATASRVLAFMLPRRVASLAVQHAAALRLTVSEWGQIFGKGSVFTNKAEDERRKSAFADVDMQSSDSVAALYSSTLRCTLDECRTTLSANHPALLYSAHVALYADECQDRLNALFGTLVRADFRRVEELAGELDYSDAFDELAMDRTIRALAFVAKMGQN